MKDNFLWDIQALLAEIVEKNCPDVRHALRMFRDQYLRQISHGQQPQSLAFE
jgi:hypothetical protein